MKLKERKKKESEKGERHIPRHRHVRSVFVAAVFDVFVGCFSFFVCSASAFSDCTQ